MTTTQPSHRLTDKDKSFLRLIMRSTPDENGWCRVSTQVWPLVSMFPHKELIETKSENDIRLIRLSMEGKIVVKYLVG